MIVLLLLLFLLALLLASISLPPSLVFTFKSVNEEVDKPHQKPLLLFLPCRGQPGTLNGRQQDLRDGWSHPCGGPCSLIAQSHRQGWGREDSETVRQ